MNPLSQSLLILAADEAATKAPTAGDPSVWWGWLVFLGIVAVIVIPFVLGSAIARFLKMREYSTKIGIVLFTLVLGLSPFVWRAAAGENPLDAIRLGIDLAGGTNMVFVVDHVKSEELGKKVTPDVMDKMVAAISKRVNPTGTEEVTVRKVSTDRIEVIVPGAEKERVEETKRLILNLGQLEFARLARAADDGDLIAQAREAGPDASEVTRNGEIVGMWRHAALDAEGNPKVQVPGVYTRTREIDGEPVVEYLVAVDPDPSRRITGRLLVQVGETITDEGLAVSFLFNDRGGNLFQQLTAKYQPRQGVENSHLAILLNNEIHSAPTIEAVIGKTGVIQGRFTQNEIDQLVSVLNAGALEVPLVQEPVSEFTISPLLGIDVQRKGFVAISISMIAVFIVTGVYYLMSGFVADVCLAFNIVLIMGAMSLIEATFTLPGLAGLVLTIGMAVDANVLIFERMREERAKGSSLRMSIKNGFEKAFSTIFDANVTTLLTAVVLYYIGTDQVKGFAVTLFIGILISMFTAVFIGRLIFDIAEHKRWIKDLKMMNLVHAERIDFLGKKKIAIGISTLLIVIGLVAVGSRGAENLDIDFRGGSMVTFKFDGQTPTTAEVRKQLEPQFEKSVSLEQLQLDGGQILYRLRTIVSDPHEVSEKIQKAFESSPFNLVQQVVTLGEVQEIPVPSADSAKDSELPERFQGGHTATVQLTEEMLPSAVAGSAADALKGNPQFPDPQDAIQAVATNGKEGRTKDITLRLAGNVPMATVNQILQDVKADLSGTHFDEVNTFDSSVAGDTQRAALTAMFFSLLAIIGYLWIRFQRVAYGLAACLALVHDVLIVLGMVAIGAYLSGNPVGNLLRLEDFKINLPMVAAFLTIVGYSLNDTIVVFDRIREMRGRNPALTEQMVNQSLNQTLSRTLLTSATTMIVVVILYFMGGEGIHGFAYCLSLGILVGTYSSIYVASPFLVWFSQRQRRKMASAT